MIELSGFPEDHENDRARVANHMNMTRAEVQDLLETLPYSVIPSIHDVLVVVRWFETNGWKRSKEVSQ